MKGDYALQDLQRQWPEGIVGNHNNLELLDMHGTLVNEPGSRISKFGFVMPRCWGDLRSLLDLRMERQNAQGPPFALPQTKRLMYWIVEDMVALHRRGIIHRDLKASNVLLMHCRNSRDILSSTHPELVSPYVADWECSIGVLGTGLWRAPEILAGLKKRTPSAEVKFNEKMDVYSFGMTCYEIVTGLTPFEGLGFSNELRDAVLRGYRPELPHDLDFHIKVVITSCWDPDPSLRPSFGSLKENIERLRLV